jgi:hypothetical protein
VTQQEDSFHVRNTVPSVTVIDYLPYVLGVDVVDGVGDSNDNDGDNGGAEYDGLVEQHKDAYVRNHGYKEFLFDHHLVVFALDSNFFPPFINVQHNIQY